MFLTHRVCWQIFVLDGSTSYRNVWKLIKPGQIPAHRSVCEKPVLCARWYLNGTSKLRTVIPFAEVKFPKGLTSALQRGDLHTVDATSISGVYQRIMRCRVCMGQQQQQGSVAECARVSSSSRVLRAVSRELEGAAAYHQLQIALFCSASHKISNSIPECSPRFHPPVLHHIRVSCSCRARAGAKRAICSLTLCLSELSCSTYEPCRAGQWQAPRREYLEWSSERVMERISTRVSNPYIFEFFDI